MPKLLAMTLMSGLEMSMMGIPRTDLSRVVSFLLFEETILDDSDEIITSLNFTFFRSTDSSVTGQVDEIVLTSMTSLVGATILALETALPVVGFCFDALLAMVNM